MTFPSVSAIKGTVTYNKTANINDESCSLSTKLTAIRIKNCKNHKTWYYSASCWHSDDM